MIHQTTTLALTMPDGSLAIMNFVTLGPGVPQREVTAETVATECARAGLAPIRWRVLASGELPAERDFRAAWRDGGPDLGITHDLAAARDVYRDRVRRQRARMLAELDVAAVRALEAGEDVEPVAVRKRQLRDAPADPRIEACQSVDELRALEVL